MWESLKGKKTYIVVALMIMLSLLNQDMDMFMQALAIAGLRDALK